MKASMEYQASWDLGPLQPDTPQNSVRSLLNALLLKQGPNQVVTCTGLLTKRFPAFEIRFQLGAS